MAALRFFGDAFRPPPFPPVTPRPPFPARKMSMLLSSSPPFMSLIVSSALVDGSSFWESNEMGKQRKTRKRKNNATDTVPIAGLSFVDLRCDCYEANSVYIYICMWGGPRQNLL
ncbi:hypothetical protein AtNW77_Chr1g0017701 [Arabidopsis thaliana]|uniref:Uncharacterized protein n=3 Tax=Arabidopsis thaliana TaxID=3702 RepID=Q5XVK8_ARATH|nr:uncharacterized protein AT1G16025 [Arabidopsis thaliana]AAU44384.1 hypothetical protein AT1G16025 [Arabidopsis thaliana]AEE29401.1 hypothetical protein AT1G16025 [Arabidopsis thaliana]CAA0209695.1 unnamed protein product [Arabidopsis thaliana]|eukprot:NP_683310.1 hypothetical protein AT1G16025 [Arabidopsis thaliana]